MSSSPPSPPLDVLQRWMQAVITHPAGAAAGAQSASARGEIDLPADQLESVVARSRAQTSLERLDIYANAYFARLLECLRADFPMLTRAVGEEAFNQLAADYLQRFPSRSYTLNRLGEGFAGYLAESRPVVDSTSGDWPRLLVELAQWERAISEVFDGPGLEQTAAADFSLLAKLTPEEFARGRIATSPSLRLLEFRFPVNAYWQALREGDAAAPPGEAPVQLALTRVKYVVRRLELEQAEYAALRGLQAGLPIAAALQEAAHCGEAMEAQEQRLAEWFHKWARGGLIWKFLPAAADGAA